MKEVRFVVLGDIQLGRERIVVNWWDKIFYWIAGVPIKQAVVGEEIGKRLKAAVKRINLLKPDFVVVIGDITESGSPEQNSITREILSGLEVPCLLLLGNHDIWPYNRENGEVVFNAKKPITVEEFENFFESFFHYFSYFLEKQEADFQNYAFVLGDIRFVVVDNVNRKQSPFGLPGAIGLSKLHPESEQWIKQQLECDEKKIIIFSHGPLGKKIFRGMPKQKQILCIAGHTHKRSEKRKQNLVKLTTNALYHEPLILEILVSVNDIRYQFLSI